MRRPPLPGGRADRRHEFARLGKHSREPELLPPSSARTLPGSRPGPAAAFGGISDMPPRNTVPTSDQDHSTSSLEPALSFGRSHYLIDSAGQMMPRIWSLWMPSLLLQPVHGKT